MFKKALLVSFCVFVRLFVCPHERTQLPEEGFSGCFMLGTSIRRETQSYFKIGQETLNEDVSTCKIISP